MTIHTPVYREGLCVFFSVEFEAKRRGEEIGRSFLESFLSPAHMNNVLMVDTYVKSVSGQPRGKGKWLCVTREAAHDIIKAFYNWSAMSSYYVPVVKMSNKASNNMCCSREGRLTLRLRNVNERYKQKHQELQGLLSNFIIEHGASIGIRITENNFFLTVKNISPLFKKYRCPNFPLLSCCVSIDCTNPPRPLLACRIASIIHENCKVLSQRIGPPSECPRLLTSSIISVLPHDHPMESFPSSSSPSEESPFASHDPYLDAAPSQPTADLKPAREPSIFGNKEVCNKDTLFLSNFEP